MSSIQAVRTATIPRAAEGFEPTVERFAKKGEEQMSGGIPRHVLRAYDNAGQGFASQTRGAMPIMQPGFVVSDQSAKKLLDKAEKLAQDAFARASQPGATLQDKLSARREMELAEGYRATASRGRTPEEKGQIDEVNTLEEDALARVSQPGSGFWDRLIGQLEMGIGDSVTKQLDSELSRPQYWGGTIQPL